MRLDSGKSLHCFLVGVNTSYVIATSDLTLHSSVLPTRFPCLTPHPVPRTNGKHKHFRGTDILIAEFSPA